MNIEKMTPQQDETLRKQTIDAVTEGTALPTFEGMYDPEIAQAFKDRLNEMSPEEFEEFSEEFVRLSTEVMDEIINGDESATSIFESINGTQLLKHLAKYFGLGFAAIAGGLHVAGASGLEVLGTAVMSLYMGSEAISNATLERIGRQKLDSVKRNSISLAKALEQVLDERENSNASTISNSDTEH
jgi:hypothetical protein